MAQVQETIARAIEQLGLQVVALELLQIRTVAQAPELGNPVLRALTWRLTYQAADRTLTAQEVEDVKKLAVEKFIVAQFWQTIARQV